MSRLGGLNQRTEAGSVTSTIAARVQSPRGIGRDPSRSLTLRAPTQPVCGLSRLSVWWITLGITPDRMEPGRPQHIGRHEPARLGGAGCTGR
ncbi:MAG: hypothetical protein AAF791_07800 [Bacteroidota bacterium]